MLRRSEPQVVSDLGRKVLRVVAVWAAIESLSLFLSGPQTGVVGAPCCAIAYALASASAAFYQAGLYSVRRYRAAFLLVPAAPALRAVSLLTGAIFLEPVDGWPRATFAILTHGMLAAGMWLFMRLAAPLPPPAGGRES